MEFEDGGHLVFPNGMSFESNLDQVMPYHPVKFQILSAEGSLGPETKM